MSEQTQANQKASSHTPSSKALVVLFWAYVALPLAWGVYETSTGVVALFTG